jgi:hypothetical protein
LGAARFILDRGYPAEPGAALASPDGFDREVGRVAARRLGILARWLGPRRPVLAMVYDDEERRSLRTLLRGAAQGAAPAARVRGLLPTPALSERGLELLSGADSPAALIRLLVRQGHPAGRALQAAASAGPATPAGRPGLFRMEMALSMLFSVRVARAARRGGRLVRRFAATLIDLENAWTLLGLRSWYRDVEPADLHLPGGAILSRQLFLALAPASTGDAARLHRGLEVAFRPTPLGRLFGKDADARSPLESRALAALIAWLRSEARREPLGAGVLLGVLQRIRAEAHDVRAAVGGAELGAPLATVESLLVTAA